MSQPLARHGFTLSEMLAALAVMVALAGFSWPAMRNTLDGSRLRGAAKEVCVELAKARLRAMQSGAPQEFRYQSGTGRFALSDRRAAGDEGDDSFEQRDTATTGGRSEPHDALHALGDRHDLPVGVAFAEPATSEAAPSQSGARPASTREGVEVRRTQDSSDEDQEAWSAPIVFFPDGKTTDASIRLAGQQQCYIDVMLRGLTGVATATAAHRDEERR